MIGKELAGFRVLEELAEGGMGVVYRGESREGLPVAIKVLRSDLGLKREDVGRFIREAVIYKRLIHPNLIRFEGFGFDNDSGFFLVTELLHGQDLGELLMELGAGVPLPLAQCFDVALQICAGLMTAHEAGVIHRDLKPANIFLAEQEDGSELVKVFDFGIGKMLEQEQSSGVNHKLTVVGEALGTPLYMAPEQFAGDPARIGPGVDIYAFGVMLFQMLTGYLPFSGDHPLKILHGHLKEKPPQLRKHERFYAGTDLEVLVDELLAKEPFERPRSMKHVRERLWQLKQLLTLGDHGATQMELPVFRPIAFEDDGGGETEMDTMDELKAHPAEQTDVQKAAAVLLLRTPEGEEEVGWLLPGERMIVGSGWEAGARVNVRRVASEHAELYCAPEGWITIRGLEGQVVRVNGASISTIVLRDGDLVTLGDAELRLHCFAS